MRSHADHTHEPSLYPCTRITGIASLDRTTIPLSHDVWPLAGSIKNDAPILIVNNNEIIVIADILKRRSLLISRTDLIDKQCSSYICIHS